MISQNNSCYTCTCSCSFPSATPPTLLLFIVSTFIELLAAVRDGEEAGEDGVSDVSIGKCVGELIEGV